MPTSPDSGPDIQDFADRSAARWTPPNTSTSSWTCSSSSTSPRRDQLNAELEAGDIPSERHDAFLENPDEYTAERVFWVPPDARWDRLQAKAIDTMIAQHIDDAIVAVKRNKRHNNRMSHRYFDRRGVTSGILGNVLSDVISPFGVRRAATQAPDNFDRAYKNSPSPFTTV